MSDKPDTEFDVGGVWDESEWSIQYDQESDFHDAKRCPHAVDLPPNHYFQDRWAVPRVVVATNEGGFNSTGVCLDCILDAAAQLDHAPRDVDSSSC